MLHPARLLTALLVLVAGLLLRSVVGEVHAGPDTPSEAALASVHNQPLVEQLGLRWKLVDDVQDAHAGYSGGPRFGLVTAYAVCGSCDLHELQQRLARDIWTSELVHVTAFKVSVAHEDARGTPLVHTWDPVRDAAQLYDSFGNGLVDPDKVTSS